MGVTTPRLLPEVTAMELTMARGLLSPVTEVTPLAPSARSMLRDSATRCPRPTRGRSQAGVPLRAQGAVPPHRPQGRQEGLRPCLWQEARPWPRTPLSLYSMYLTQ